MGGVGAEVEAQAGVAVGAGAEVAAAAQAAAEVAAAAAVVAAAKREGARAGAGRGGGGAEVARGAEIARRWGRGGPCRPFLSRGPGCAIRSRLGAALRLSPSLAVAAVASQGSRLRTRGADARSEATSSPSLPPAEFLPPRPPGEPEAGRRAAGWRAAGCSSGFGSQARAGGEFPWQRPRHHRSPRPLPGLGHAGPRGLRAAGVSVAVGTLFLWVWGQTTGRK